jgi:hypothetical protein
MLLSRASAPEAVLKEPVFWTMPLSHVPYCTSGGVHVQGAVASGGVKAAGCIGEKSPVALHRVVAAGKVREHGKSTLRGVAVAVAIISTGKNSHVCCSRFLSRSTA